VTREDAIRIEPWDEHSVLVDNVHAPDWVNLRPAGHDGSDRIVGATVVARHAGEMLPALTLAVTRGLGLAKIAETIHTYPTQAEAIRKLGDAWNRARLTRPVRRAFRARLRWTR
jgi:Pyridine nucleotide-disulphide oxidoreductase, dimerisation domain